MVAARATRSASATVVATFQSAPRRRAPRCWSGPTARRSARCRAAASRARCTSSPSRCWRTGTPVLAALRRQRRGRVRGRADLRRHPRRLRRGGRPADLPRARRRGRRHRGGRARRGGDRGRARRPELGRPAADHPPRGRTDAAVAGTLGSTRADDAVAADARGLLAAGRNETLHYGPDGQRRGEGMAVFVVVVRTEAADAGVRRDRLRRRGGPGRLVPRLPRDRLRRAAGVRDRDPVPRGRRGRRQVAAQVPRRGGRRPAGSTRAR